LKTIKINNWWIDPINKSYYTYTTDKATKKIQILWYLETTNNEVKYFSEINPIKRTYATTTNTNYYLDKKVYIYWDKIWTITENKVPLQEITNTGVIDLSTYTGALTTYFWWEIYESWTSTKTWATLINEINWAITNTIPCNATSYSWYTIT
jgi:hypothetical protein